MVRLNGMLLNSVFLNFLVFRIITDPGSAISDEIFLRAHSVSVKVDVPVCAQNIANYSEHVSAYLLLLSVHGMTKTNHLIVRVICSPVISAAFNSNGEVI